MKYRHCFSCWREMHGIYSHDARRNCAPCGGVALNVRNGAPSTLEQLLAKYPYPRAQKRKKA